MKKLNYFSTYSVNYNYHQTTMTTTTTHDNAINTAEPEVPFNTTTATATATADTPRPTTTSDTATAAATAAATATAYPSFAQAAKKSATAMKHRRSLKTRTHYCLTASSRVQKAFQKLASYNEMPHDDFELLKTALDRYRVRLNVSDQMTVAELRTLLLDTRFEEQEAERATYEAFRTNTATDTAVDAAEIEIDAIKYCEAREKYNDMKYWRETLVKEEMRVTPMVPPAGYGNIKAIPVVPTQHAQIAPTSGTILRNILKPETIRRKFISLKVLTQKISEEVAHFLTDTDRHADRICVVRGFRPPTAETRGVPPPNGGNYVR